MSSYKKRYDGTRWRIVFGSYDGIGKFSLNELQRSVQDCLPYVVETVPAEVAGTGYHEILVGTPDNNSRIAGLVDSGFLKLPDAPQSYAVKVSAAPENADLKLAVIAGTDDSGTLYGVQDFNSRVIAGLYPDSTAVKRKLFDEMGDVSFTEKPLINNRGIWTWGYVIYDYRRFIDNMARLKMNMLTIWNDCVPLNMDDVVRYAHDRGVKIVMGFHWGWGLKDMELGNPEHRKQIKEIVLAEYEQNYSRLGVDGIYFQTLTEMHKTETCGTTVAAAATMLVNDVAGELLKRYPGIDIQFGLHAISILDDYPELAALDPRVTITWEDAGVVPYSYNPVTVPSGWTQADGIDTYEKTIEYSRKLIGIRPDSEFAMVPKGFICLRWGAEFEHHGAFVLGERSGDFISARLRERQARWDEVNSLWFRHYPLAVGFYREMLDCNPRSMCVTALIEDGMFEERIQPSAALYAETIWNPHRTDEQILALACSSYYKSCF